MLVSTSLAIGGPPNFAVPTSPLTESESLTKAAPSTRQNTSALSVSTRLHWGQRFILNPEPSDHSALADLRADFVTTEFCAEGDHRAHFKSLIKTTSRCSGPRESASHLPSGDQSNLKIRSDLKLVNCFAGLPSSG